MEQIAIIFFALNSFLGMEDNTISADKTTVTVYPRRQIIEITQQDLFAIVHSDTDATYVKRQWASVSAHSQQGTGWAKALAPFPSKTITLVTVNNQVQPQLTLSYNDEKDLRAMGIWYNADKNHFSINHVPRDNLQTTDGKLIGNYWVFNVDQPFSFTLEPIHTLPQPCQKSKRTLSKLLTDSR
ncbi:hypothetical protein [uncultured Psychrobacter sp.]|uniref:hypothetical protein n=1 Tax=uncultured Psychrobacter sp. TaxID=259303 RepID=UPI00263792E5|nr:hypothetical protein [uncultured Psychrobacter sp.]